MAIAIFLYKKLKPMTFNITEHIEFDQKGRAHCPVCLADGKKTKNLSLIPNTDGAYKCHRGCSSDDIRNAIGQPKSENSGDRIVPTALAQPKKQPKYHNQADIEGNNQRLINESKLAKQWLSDRGIGEMEIDRHHLGIVKKQIAKYEGKNIVEKKLLPCITVPYLYNQGYLQKYFVAPWLTSEERLDTRMIQDYGLSARWWFTRSTESKELWICEGEWDAIALAKLPDLKFDICTSTTGAGNIPTDLSDLQQYDQIYIWYDLDHPDSKGKKPGPDGAIKLQAKLGDRAKICTVPHRENYKSGYDISDAIKHGYTLEQFIQASTEAIAPNKTKNDVRDRLISTQELLDRAPDFVEFLVHDLITINELQIIAAPPRAGKSLLSLGLVEAVASGKEFLGRPTQQGDVIYVNCEDGESKLKERVLAQGWDPNIPVHWLTEFDMSEWEKLFEICQDIKPKLLVIDTLTSVRSDDTDENSSKIANVIKPLKKAAKYLNMAVVLVHHTKKLNVQNLSDVDIFDTMRGSGTIRSESRGTIMLAEVANTETRRNEWRLIAENGSYGKQDLLVVLDANTLSWKCLSNWTPNCSESQEAQALAFFDKVGAASIQQLSENTSIPAKSAYTVATRLVQRGMLVKQGTRQNAVYIRAIQQIQQLNCLLNSQKSDTVSDTPVNSTKNNIFNSTDTQLENIAPATTEKSSMCQSVELEAQTLTQQAIPNSTSNSTESNKPKSVEQNRLKVGDYVQIKAGGLSGKVGLVERLDKNAAYVTGTGFGMEQKIPIAHLQVIS
jgi:hypothetical protein